MKMDLLTYKYNTHTSVYLTLVVLPPYESNQYLREQAALRAALCLSALSLACISLAYSDLWQLNRESITKGRS